MIHSGTRFEAEARRHNAVITACFGSPVVVCLCAIAVASGCSGIEQTETDGIDSAQRSLPMAAPIWEQPPHKQGELIAHCLHDFSASERKYYDGALSQMDRYVGQDGFDIVYRSDSVLVLGVDIAASMREHVVAEEESYQADRVRELPDSFCVQWFIEFSTAEDGSRIKVEAYCLTPDPGPDVRTLRGFVDWLTVELCGYQGI